MNVVSATPALPDQWILKKLKYVAHMAAGDAITSNEIREEGDYPVFGGNGLRGFTDRFNREGDLSHWSAGSTLREHKLRLWPVLGF